MAFRLVGVLPQENLKRLPFREILSNKAQKLPWEYTGGEKAKFSKTYAYFDGMIEDSEKTQLNDYFGNKSLPNAKNDMLALCAEIEVRGMKRLFDVERPFEDTPAKRTKKWDPNGRHTATFSSICNRINKVNKHLIDPL